MIRLAKGKEISERDFAPFEHAWREVSTRKVYYLELTYLEPWEAISGLLS